MWIRSGESFYNTQHIKRIFAMEEKVDSSSQPVYSVNFETIDGYVYPLAYFPEQTNAVEWINSIFNVDGELHFSPGPFIELK